jgi:preprotein translocase subunit SecA
VDMFSLKGVFGGSNASALKPFYANVDAINTLEKSVSSLSDSEFKSRTESFRKSLVGSGTLDELLPEAYATVREAAQRTLTQRHFDVQLLGGIALHEGNIAEMKTGEGKTLVATLPVYLNALEGKGVHVVTVNDYLARRDAVWMGQIYAFLGLSVGVLNDQDSFLYDAGHTELDQERDEEGSFKVVHEFLRPCTRKEAYLADVTYGTNSQFGFDYLRDNIEYDAVNMRQRGHHFAIVDEIDSILIDEARTPLIISAPSTESGELYVTFARVADRLNKDTHFSVDEKHKAIALTDEGIEKAEQILGIENIYTEKGIKYVHHLETAVRAKALFSKDKEYVVRDGSIVIVDEFTGRMQPGRRWSEGLHQAIEAKEGVPIQKESRTFASITYQNFFRMYDKLSGMTGTALTSQEEFHKVYGLETLAIPTNTAIARTDEDDLIFQTEKGKFTALARTVRELHGRGQPVLIGTASIEKNELLSSFLKREGTPHEVLNAKNHDREGEIIAQAGERGKVTIATNMAGRGVDIKLGGNPGSEDAYKSVRELGGLYVIGTERHEARRIDNQLRGRSGRQGDPGKTQFYVSLEDALMRVFASDAIGKMMGRFGIPEDEPIKNSLITKSLETAQTKIEGFHFDSRKHVLAYDDVMNHQRSAVYDRRRSVLTGTERELADEIEKLVAGDKQIEKVLREKRETLGEDQYNKIVRQLVLQTMDIHWVEHLEVMDYMRGSVNLRAYGQRDPLIEYRKEGLRLFREMQDAVDEQIVRLLPNIGAGEFAREEQKLREVHKDASLIGGSDKASTGMTRSGSVGKKVGRNDPCPCGAVNPRSGKVYKYKHCGLINASHHEDK